MLRAAISIVIISLAEHSPDNKRWCLFHNRHNPGAEKNRFVPPKCSRIITQRLNVTRAKKITWKSVGVVKRWK